MTSHTLTSPDLKIKVEWIVGSRNPATDSLYSRIVAAVQEDDVSVRVLYALIMANTREIKFTCKTTPPEQIAMLQQFWGWMTQYFYIQEAGVNVGITENADIIKASYVLFNRLVCNELQEHWGAAYNKAQVLFPSDDLVKPPSALPAGLLSDPDFLLRVAKLLKA